MRDRNYMDYLQGPPLAPAKKKACACKGFEWLYQPEIFFCLSIRFRLISYNLNCSNQLVPNVYRQKTYSRCWPHNELLIVKWYPRPKTTVTVVRFRARSWFSLLDRCPEKSGLHEVLLWSRNSPGGSYHGNNLVNCLRSIGCVQVSAWKCFTAYKMVWRNFISLLSKFAFEYDTGKV